MYSCEARIDREVGACLSGRTFLYICIHLPTYIVRQTRVLAQVYNFKKTDSASLFLFLFVNMRR